MTRSLRVLVADPAARTVETPTGTWIVAGVNVPRIVRFLEEATSIPAVKRGLPERTEDAMVLNVADDAGRTVHAFRSVTGGHRLYWTTLPNGEFVVADHLRNALAACPVSHRTVEPEAIVDHLLFRAPVGATGLVEEIDGLEQGVWRTWDLEEGTTDAERIDSLIVPSEITPSEAPGSIESTYERLVDADGFAGDPINLFSGGVDSTLTQTFLEGATMLNVGVDSPEYEYEIEYARESATYFDDPFEQEIIDESAVLEHLERSIDALGSPSCPFQILMIDEALRRYSGRRYVMAVGADSIFGNVPVKGPRYADWASRLLSSPVGSEIGRLGPDRLQQYLSWLESLDAQFDHELSDPQSYAHQYATYANPEYAARMFDTDLVEDRVAAQTAYVTDRVPIDPTATRFARQMEARHMNLVFGHRVGSRWRQLAVAHGNALTNPFETRSMIETSLSIPAEQRFVQGPSRFYNVSAKYLLKRLLRKRLPNYPIEQPKGAGVLPYERYRESGPLQTAFDTYSVPSFVPDDQCEAILEDEGRQAWNLLTYAVWRDRVLENPDLRQLPTTDELAWNVPRV